MSMLIKHDFGKVQAFQMGYSWLGTPPLLTVHSYIVDGLLIDTGSRRLYKQFFKQLASHTIAQIAVTHYHEDHSGNAEPLRKHYGVPLHMGDYTAQQLSQKLDMKMYRHWNFGQIVPIKTYTPFSNILETDAYQFEPIHTPGHSDDHFVLYERRQGWLFSGDLYLGNIKFTREEENLPAMLQSLNAVRQLDFEALFCAHYPRIQRGKAFLVEKIQYIEDFIGQVRLWHSKGLPTHHIRKALGRQEAYLLKLLTFNDIGVDFMIRAALKNATRPIEAHQV